MDMKKPQQHRSQKQQEWHHRLFFAAFENKEALLLTLVKTMFGSQFENTGAILGENADPLLIYGVETSLQMYIAEMSEPLRELYVVGYSLPTTSEYIYISTAKKLQFIFAEYMGTAELKDYYEMVLPQPVSPEGSWQRNAICISPWKINCEDF